MTTETSNLTAELEELCKTSMELFCQDIEGMFGVTMKYQQKSGCMETANHVRKQYKNNIAAVISARAKGHLNGSFYLVFDREGLFTLAGVIIMQPKPKILDNRRTGSLAEAESIRDSIQESGNLLVGSWNRICLDNWGKDNHLLQTGTFIGNPWTSTQQAINTAEGEEFLYIPCEMTIGDYPTFTCGVVFSKEIRGLQTTQTEETGTAPDTKQKEAEPPKAAVQEKPAEVQKTEAPAQGKPAEVQKTETPAQEKPAAAEQQKVTADLKTPSLESKPAETKEASAPDKKADSNSQGEITPKAELSAVAADSEPSHKSAPETAPAPVGTAGISSGTLLPVQTDQLWHLCARDVMKKNVIWCESDESIEQVRIKMDRNDVNYVLVGSGEVIEGIVARSDLTATMSPYLRPIFAQWRRPLDEASLQIKVKWAMTRPVHIVKPEKSLAMVMETMCRFGVRALPVVDAHGKVEGLITVFDIFRALLKSNEENVVIAKTA